ncbi:Major Facilitator Superfamily Transporter [Abortiporus biennis]
MSAKVEAGPLQVLSGAQTTLGVSTEEIVVPVLEYAGVQDPPTVYAQRTEDVAFATGVATHPDIGGKTQDIEAHTPAYFETVAEHTAVVVPSNETTSYPPPANAGLVVLEETQSLRRLRMGASFFALFLAGWNGGATGALIPHIEQTFGISYARVAVLFIATFVGYIVAAAITGSLARRVGFGHAVCISVIIELMGNVINSSQQVSFNLMCFGFFVVGIAFATQLGLCNAYFATLDRPLLWTGVLHGIYGLGAFASPLVATAMVTKGVPFHIFYTTNIGMNVPVFVIMFIAFRNLHTLPQNMGEGGDTSNSSNGAFWDTLKSRSVWTLAIFLMLYVGAEESIGGWIVSYILEVRHGSPEGASWVASSFYLGIGIGRIALPALNILMGERRAVFIYLILAIALELLAWFLPFLASTAVCTALVGLAISTFYTAAITTGGKLIPRNMHADAFALMSSVGQSGSAFWPLIVGVMSTKRGIWVVEPTVVALLGAQGICWWLVPKVGRRTE